MKKVVSYQLLAIRLIKIVFILVFLLQPITYNVQPTLAVNSTQSASPSASLQTKLKILQEEIASKAAKLKAEVSNKLQNKAYIGTIKSKSDDSLILIIRNSDKTVKINKFTEFIIPLKKGSKIKPSIKNLEIEDYIVALGDVDESDILTAKKIIKTTPPQEIKQIFFGEVLAVNENVITLKNDKNLAVSTSNQTVFKAGKGNGSLADVKIGQKIIVSGVENNNIIKASFVYIFSSSSNIKIKTSSPSAQIKVASPSAVPKKK